MTMPAHSPQNYTAFTDKDFIGDPFFQEWVLKPDAEINHFWQQFIISQPQKKEAIEIAAGFLKNLQFKEDFPADERVKQLFKEHLRQVKESEDASKMSVRRLMIKLTAVAALVAGIITGAYFLFFNNRPGTETVVLATQYGEKQQLSLSDSSVITLNAHSQLTFSKAFDPGKPREVWLNGEAFFDIRHWHKKGAPVKPSDHFLVHGKAFTIEVLGTTFNVRQRREYAEIVLQKGSIRLTLKDKNHTQFVMQPGEMVAYNETSQQITRSAIPVQEYTAWKDNKLILNNPTLEEITRYLEDNYGKKIIISDAGLKTKKIEGPILLDNLDDALFIVSTVLKTKVERTDSAIIIRAK